MVTPIEEVSALTMVAEVAVVPVQAARGTGGTPTDVPLDGGLSLLLVAGAAYGVKRARTQKAKGEAGR